jgi:hypothetical protein
VETKAPAVDLGLLVAVGTFAHSLGQVRARVTFPATGLSVRAVRSREISLFSTVLARPPIVAICAAITMLGGVVGHEYRRFFRMALDASDRDPVVCPVRMAALAGERCAVKADPMPEQRKTRKVHVVDGSERRAAGVALLRPSHLGDPDITGARYAMRTLVIWALPLNRGVAFPAPVCGKTAHWRVAAQACHLVPALPAILPGRLAVRIDSRERPGDVAVLALVGGATQADQYKGQH